MNACRVGMLNDYPLLIVQEGLFLYTHNLSPYDGGVFYQVSTSVYVRIGRGITDEVIRHHCYSRYSP